MTTNYLVVVNKTYYPSVFQFENKQVAQTVYDDLAKQYNDSEDSREGTVFLVDVIQFSGLYNESTDWYDYE